MQRVEDQVLAVVGPAVPGDHLGPAADHHLIDVAPDEHLRRPRARIVVAAVTHQRQRTRPSRALVAGIVWCREARRLLARRSEPRHLAAGGSPREHVEGLEALGPRDGDQEVRTAADEADQSLDLAFVVALARPAEPVLEQIREDGVRCRSPRMRATASLVLSYRMDHAAEERNRRLWPSQNASVVSAGYLHEQASLWGRSKARKWPCAPGRSPPSPPAAWAWPGEWTSGTNISRDRSRRSRT